MFELNDEEVENISRCKILPQVGVVLDICCLFLQNKESIY